LNRPPIRKNKNKNTEKTFFFFSTDWASLKMRKTLQTSLTLSTSVLLLLLLLLPCTQEINIDAIAELDFFLIFILSLITFCSLSLSRVSPPRPGLSFLALVCSSV
jgi:archaellum biogenesis protein FlaJ (TadC family)